MYDAHKYHSLKVISQKKYGKLFIFLILLFVSVLTEIHVYYKVLTYLTTLILYLIVVRVIHPYKAVH